MPERNSDKADNNSLRKYLRQRAKDLRQHAERLEALANELKPMSPLAEQGLYLEMRYKIFQEE